jgi:hypothetical protein
VMAGVNSSGSHYFSLQSIDLFRSFITENYETKSVIVFTHFLSIGCVNRFFPQNPTTWDSDLLSSADQSLFIAFRIKWIRSGTPDQNWKFMAGCKNWVRRKSSRIRSYLAGTIIDDSEWLANVQNTRLTKIEADYVIVVIQTMVWMLMNISICCVKNGK